MLFFMCKNVAPTLPTMQPNHRRVITGVNSSVSSSFLWSHKKVLYYFIPLPETCKHTLMGKIGGVTIYRIKSATSRQSEGDTHTHTHTYTPGLTVKDGCVRRRRLDSSLRGPQRRVEALRGGSHMKQWSMWTSHRLPERWWRLACFSGFPPFPLKDDLSGAPRGSVQHQERARRRVGSGGKCHLT